MGSPVERSVDEKLDRALILRDARRRRDRQLLPVHVAARARRVVLVGGKVLTDERPRQPPVHRDVRAPDEVEHAQRVVGRVLDGDIAVHGRDSHELERRMERGEHDRDGIVRAGIDVEDHLLPHRHYGNDPRRTVILQPSNGRLP
jgi:hypothetical protein